MVEDPLSDGWETIAKVAYENDQRTSPIVQFLASTLQVVLVNNGRGCEGLEYCGSKQG